MLRRVPSLICRCTNRSILINIGRNVRGGVASASIPDPTPALRFGYGVKKRRVKEEELASDSEAGQRLASFYGHPRLPQEVDNEWQKAKPSFDQIEEDEQPDAGVSGPIVEEDEFIDDRFRIQSPDQLGHYQPLDRPIPAPKRKPRAFLQTYTLTPLVNDSELLRNLVDVGVNLSKFDNLHNVADWLLKLDWEKDVRPVLQFLVETAGIPLEKLGEFVTANPWILQQSIDDLKVRIRYLESKNFSKEAITRIIIKARYWLNFHVKTIDKRLGWIQTNFQLSGDEVRFVVTHSPKMVTLGTGYMQLIQFAVKEEMGFKEDEMRQLILKDPKLWTAYKTVIIKSFDYLHNKMKLSHQDILACPSVLRAPYYILRQRHEYLKTVGRDQFDPTKPNYVSLHALGKYTDQEFAENVAMTSVGEYNKFLKKF